MAVDPLQAAMTLVERLGGPDGLDGLGHSDQQASSPVRRRIQLRQIAGLSAGNAMELSPGNWEFGPSDAGPGGLQDGQPDQVGFILHVDDRRRVTLTPAASPVRVGGRPVRGRVPIDGEIIDAGSARFVIAQPRSTAGPTPAVTDEDPWVLAPLVEARWPGRDENTADGVADLISRRRGLHLGPDELRHRLACTPCRESRSPGHPLFGTAVAGVVDLPVGPAGCSVPQSIDLVGSDTVVLGARDHQLAVVRQLILGLVATTDPRHLRVSLHGAGPELRFLQTLPHLTGIGESSSTARSTVVVVDRSRPSPPSTQLMGHWRLSRGRPGRDRWPILRSPGSLLVIGRAGDPTPTDADVITVTDEATATIVGGRSGVTIHRVAPIGVSPETARFLVERVTGR